MFVGPKSNLNFAEKAAKHHVFVIPTLSVLQAICGSAYSGHLAGDQWLSPYLPPSEVVSLKREFHSPTKLSCEGANEAVRQLKAAGVPILAGTDAGNPGTTQGASIHGELELLVRAGLTPVEALRSATSAAAAAFQLDDRGSIAPGKSADLVLVNGDPTTDILSTRNIAAVWKAGREIDRSAWKKMVAEQVDGEAGRKRGLTAPQSESGLVSDFEEEGVPQARFGAGWAITTDQVAGGRSQAKMVISSGGAEGSKNSLLVAGDVEPGAPIPWAGVMFSPGVAMFRPADLSARKTVRFWAKGDGQAYQVMVFAMHLGLRPATKAFVASEQWKEYSMPIADFGLDGSDIIAITWSAGPKTGRFEFRLDNVKLQ